MPLRSLSGRGNQIRSRSRGPMDIQTRRMSHRSSASSPFLVTRHRRACDGCQDSNSGRGASANTSRNEVFISKSNDRYRVGRPSRINDGLRSCEIADLVSMRGS